jgi:stage III sporulation protein SpoIIIAA
MRGIPILSSLCFVASFTNQLSKFQQVIVDTSNEIGGDGDIPHSAIGGARRMQVSEPSLQHKVMVEAVENHMPEVVIVDEIGTEAEALACRTIAERGVMLVGTAHGERLENLIKNPILCDLVCFSLLLFNCLCCLKVFLQ